MLTIDRDGNGLAQGVAISANEGRNLSESVDVYWALARGSGHKLDVEVVGLCYHKNWDGARVFLHELALAKPVQQAIDRDGTHSLSVDLSERHGCYRYVLMK